jgi:hypothetical protein
MAFLFSACEGALYQILCKEFVNASWWYFVGPPPAEGGRRPHAEAAGPPPGWAAPKHNK